MKTIVRIRNVKACLLFCVWTTLWAVLMTHLLSGCYQMDNRDNGGMDRDGQAGDAGTDTDTDMDGDTDSDADTDNDADTDTGARGIYQWHTFYGPMKDPFSGAIMAMDGQDNLLIAGTSLESWKGPLGQEPEHEFNGNPSYRNVFVLKLNSTGEYQWHTFYGMYITEEVVPCYDIALDRNDNVFFAGWSSKSWKGPSGQEPLNEYRDGGDTFILKLDQNGAYQWHTFFGSSSWDTTSSVVLDDEDNIFITGTSLESWKGPSGQEPLYEYNGDGDLYCSDVFVLKLNSRGEYQWHAFFGTSSDPTNISVDSKGNIYLSGYSFDPWEGPSGEKPLNDHTEEGEQEDIFILKLDKNGSYQWHAFYGSSDQDWAYGPVLDSHESLYFAGSTGPWEGPSGQEPLHDHSGYSDVFILKLDQDGAYQWHTFLGLPDDGGGGNIAFDSEDNMYVSGGSQPWTGPAGQEPLHEHSGDQDMFIVRLNSEGAYQWHTFFGSTNDSTYNSKDFGSSIVIDSGNTLYVAGCSCAPWKGPEGQEPLHTFITTEKDGEGWISNNLFVLKLK